MKRVVVIEGEDAAPEAVRASMDVLAELGADIEWLHPPVCRPVCPRRHRPS